MIILPTYPAYPSKYTYTKEEREQFLADIQNLPSRKKVAQRAIAFAAKYAISESPTPIFDRLFTEIGNQGRKGFPHWLRTELFFCVDRRYAQGNKSAGVKALCKKYVVNADFYHELIRLVEGEQVNPTEFAWDKGIGYYRELYKNELAGLKPWEYSYSEKTGRIYHNAQLLKRTVREPLFDGYFSFDISAASPTILYQLYHRLRAERGIPSIGRTALPYVEKYIKEKQKVREKMMKQYDLPEQIVKELITAFFNSSYIAKNEFNSIFNNILDGKVHLAERLQKDEFLNGLKRDVWKFWKWIKQLSPEKVAGKQWNIYTQEESKIREIISEYIQEKTGLALNTGYFLIHDGGKIQNAFRTKIDFVELEKKIQEKSGYSLTIDEK